METQSHSIQQQAKARYEHIWTEFTSAVQRGEAVNLSAYCRTTHTSYEGMRSWLRLKGLSVRSAKNIKHPKESKAHPSISDASASFIQFSPRATQASAV